MITFKEVLMIQWEVFMDNKLALRYIGPNIPEMYYKMLDEPNITVQRTETTRVKKA